MKDRDLERVLIENLQSVRERVARACARARRRVDEVRILGASKGQPPEKIRILSAEGLKLFGENYVQEAELKMKALGDLPLEWHLIGRLQTNKVKRAIKLFNMIESLDRRELALELEKRLSKEEKVMPVLIEVNIGGEKTKTGLEAKDLERFCEDVLTLRSLEVQGLMCLPPFEENPERVRPYFAKMRELFERVKPLFGANFTELSMGTSHDFEVAIEEGATIIRLGTILFGSRS
ncbi:MAG: YggS family pyridoxal phosphate-dependent enzyme [Caldimicrobium sp.]|nr:YggS family pyridoxal phosphate-dependent enzyme [Caldimicrobium sp.]MCX7613671.1 YggS family pyridoxal phosphate-dependent enzyme [Caldimicrobium sp.]MDW8182704.1 YggS family pyridoxal phosphate-dependent enzyme [Caldimicrobium sp.]